MHKKGTIRWKQQSNNVIYKPCSKYKSYALIIILYKYLQLKAVDTFGNCQRLAFTVGVSQHNA